MNSSGVNAFSQLALNSMIVLSGSSSLKICVLWVSALSRDLFARQRRPVALRPSVVIMREIPDQKDHVVADPEAFIFADDHAMAQVNIGAVGSHQRRRNLRPAAADRSSSFPVPPAE